MGEVRGSIGVSEVIEVSVESEVSEVGEVSVVIEMSEMSGKCAGCPFVGQSGG